MKAESIAMTKRFPAGLILFVLTVSVGCQGGPPIGQTTFKQGMFGSMFTAQNSSSHRDPFQNPGPPARLQGTTLANGRVIVEGNHPIHEMTVSNSAPAIVNVGFQRQPNGPLNSPPTRSTTATRWQASQNSGIATVPYRERR